MSRQTGPAANRLLFFDLVRNAAMLSVVLYHAVAAYSTVTPHWAVHDGSSAFADLIRHFFNVFMMPVFFFVAGYFALSSLARQSTWQFLKGKFSRIGIPWLLAVFIIVPLVRYGGELKSSGHSVQSFWHYWITYLSCFGTYQIGLWTPERMNQMHFWFLSLLLIFYIVFALLYRAGCMRKENAGNVFAREPAATRSILQTLLVATVLASAGYFISICLTPDASWVTIDLLLQFQPASLILYIVCFILGAAACSRQWFAGDEFPHRLSLWIPIGLVLTAGFFLVGRNILTDSVSSNLLSPGLLLGFSFIRTLLCLAIMVILIVYSRRYWNRPSRFNQALALNSYNIYLVHIFFVTFLQDVLMVWPGGPPLVKTAIVFLAALPISYGISRLIDRFPRGFTIFLIAVFIVVLIARR